ncbi:MULTISPECIES: autotransporter domain-containing protein [unclassified Sphingomonas]|uniref:autotransporter domain-containing protein n=1 Tax=unclassified Sphingomonas TaxID=196159 RepID=UPI00138F3E97|nr:MULTISPECIES: autotransporter domain-containing protein [unclassified Sphingomonas]
MSALLAGAAGAVPYCTVTGTGTVFNCDATYVQGRGSGGTSTLTVTDLTTGSVELRLDPALTDDDGPFDQTLTITGTSVIDRADYSAVIMQTDLALRDATVIIDSDVHVSSRGGDIGAVWVRNETSGDITITNSGAITAYAGGGDGITATTNLGAVSITNSGMVSSAEHRGLYADGGYGNSVEDPVEVKITNEATGNVSGYEAGIRVIDYQGHATADNRGTVESTSRQAIVSYAANGAATILNSGSATSHDDSALYAATDTGDVTVTNSGIVSAADDPDIVATRDGYSGIRAVADISGNIEVTNDIGGSVTALDTSGTAAEDAAIYAQTPSGTVTITNRGTVHGRMAVSGLSTDGQVSLDNSSMIEGDEGGVYLDGATNSLTNSGSITTAAGIAVSTGDGDSTVSTSGSISAAEPTDTAIAFGAGDDSLILQSGYSITGLVDAGTGDDTLEIASVGSASFDASLVGASAQYRGFDTILKSGSGTLTLDFGSGGGSTGQNWHVASGTLVGSSASLGDADLQLDTGTTLQLDQDSAGELTGSLSGSGALIKNSGGTLTMSGDSGSFTGATQLAAGALDVTGSLGGTLDVASGATLTGSGSVGDVTIASGGTIAGQSGQTLGLASLTMEDGAKMAVSLGSPSTTELFNVTGDVQLNGTLSVTDAGSFGAGVYRLVSYGGSLSGVGLMIDPTSASELPGDLSIQDAVAGRVNLVVDEPSTGGGVPTGGFTFWDGGDSSHANNGMVDGGSGSWTATSATWTTVDGATNGPLQPVPAFAIFDGAGGSVRTDAGAGALSVTGMQFASNGYSITGDAIGLAGSRATIRVGDGTSAGAGYTATIGAALTGDAQLVKDDLGTLVLTGANGYTGGTVVNAGVLQGNSASIRGNLLNKATVVFDQGSDGSFGGAISGTGETVKQGAGTLTLSGQSGAYAGRTTVSAGSIVLTGTLGGTVEVRADGTLQVGDGGTNGDLTASTRNDGTLIFARSDDYDYTGALSGSGALVKRGEGALLLSGDYSYTGSTVVEGGSVRLAAALDPTTTLVVNDGDFDLGGRDQTVSGLDGTGGTLSLGAGNLVVDQSTNTSFGGSIEGTGSFTKTGSGSLNLTGTSSFTGDAIVNGGRLAVNGTLPATVTVGSTGTIGGNGTIGGLVVQDGGMAGPGNSIGLLHVDGNVTFEAGSAYQVEINAAGQGDSIAATGTATLEGGTVNVLAAPGDYSLSTGYTILTATGGVSGTFSDVTSNLAFLTPSLTYEARAVRLQVTRNDVSFDDVAATPNQRATAIATEALGTSSAVYDAVVRSNADGARLAFDQLSGEIHAAARTMMVQDASRPRDAIMARTDIAPAQAGAWMQAVGTWSDQDGNLNAAKLDYSTRGLLLGVDHMVGGAIRIGLAGGYTHSSGHLRSRSSRAKVNSGHVMAYLAGASGALHFSAGGGYSWSDVDTDRSVNIGAFSDAPNASYSGNVVQGFARIGAQFRLGGGIAEPFGSIAVMREHVGRFGETGGAAALSGDSENRTRTFSTLGLRVETPVILPGWSIRTQGGWEHGFGHLSPTRTLRFAGGTAMQIEGAGLSRNAAVVDSALIWRPADKLMLSAGYTGRIGDAGQDHGGRVSLVMAF